MVSLIPLAVLVASALACLAQETPYSKGLKRIAELGLPDMQGALWIEMPGESEAFFTSSYQFGEMNAKLSGNAWKLRTRPPSFLEFGSAITLASEKSEEKKSDNQNQAQAKPSLLGKMLRNYQEKNPEPEQPPKVAKPIVSQAAKDAAKIVKALDKPSVTESINDSIEYGNANLHGRLMLFAAQLQAAGETDSANSLAAALFKAAENDTALIDGAISHLADTEYATAVNSFFETTDWETYHSTVKTLLVKFPRGWADAPAVAILSSHLGKRATTPPPLSLPGISLQPEALALIDKLLEKQTFKTNVEELAKARGINLSQYPARQRAEMISWLRANAAAGVSFTDSSLWLLSSSEKTDKQPASPIEALKAMRMDGFIALTAALADETLVPVRKQTDSSSYYNNSESAAAIIRRRYANLARPLSRGEIATALISTALPTPEGVPYSNPTPPDPADITATAISFWKTNKDKSAIELATLYTAEGNTNQRTFAATYLASSKDPAAHTAFESTVLNAADPLSLIQAVERYLSSRKAAAKPFATAYIQLIRDNPPSDDELQSSMVGYHIREAGGTENYLKRLSLKVGDVSLSKMIAQALRAKVKPPEDDSDEPESPIAALAPAIQDIPLTECLTTFGKAASAASPTQWMEIHQLLLGRIHRTQNNTDQQESDAPKILTEIILKIWKPLVARTDVLPEKGDFPDYARAYGAKTIGDASALLIELAISPQLDYTLNNLAQAEGSADAVMALVHKRLAAWSSGKTPVEWPSAENVSDQRVKEISQKLTALKAAEIIPYAKSLTIEERFSMMEIIRDFDEKTTLPKGLRELRSTLVSLAPVFDQDHDAPAAAKLNLHIGDRITPELLTKISDSLLLDAANSSTTTVMFFSAPLGLGSGLYVTTSKDLDLAKLQGYGMISMAQHFQEPGNTEAISVISVMNGADTRLLRDGKTVTLETESSGLTAFDEALKSKSPSLPIIRISVLTRADAEKINNQD